MKLSSLNLRRSSYGVDQGELAGTLVVTTVSGDIQLRLSQEKCEQILAIVSEQLVDSAKEVAENITKEIVEHRHVLEHKESEES